jgi:hypothetical protein
MHLFHHLLHFWKHCLKDVCDITFKSFVTLVMMSSTVWNSLPLRVILSSGIEKVGEERSGEWGEGGVVEG